MKNRKKRKKTMEDWARKLKSPWKYDEKDKREYPELYIRDFDKIR